MKLDIENVCVRYTNGKQALDSVDLHISQGMFGLLGPNGAGKSTLMRTIATLQYPDNGRILYNNVDIHTRKNKFRRILGYLPQEFGVYPKISAERLLDYFALLKGIAESVSRKKVIDHVLEVTNLTDVRKVAVSTYSGGMKQRFGIAQLLLNSPEVIIVDEPTAGLDPAERKRFLNILREISTRLIVLFSTHIVEDIMELCHDMAIMSSGKILLNKTPSESISIYRGQIFQRDIERTDLESFTQRFHILSTAFNYDDTVRVRIRHSGGAPSGFSNTEPSLEDVYFLTQENRI